MTSAPGTQPELPEEPTVLPGGRAAEVERHEARNLAVLAAHQITVRVAWIFKTESVIMPAVIDAISGAGWVRGMLPVLNRSGQSIAPMILAEKLRDSRLKKRGLFATSLLMSVPFLVLAVLWYSVKNKHQPAMTVAFLGLYLTFFAFNGLMQMSFGTVQGKLIRPDRRGRLIAIAGILGSVGAVSAALLLMRNWLALPEVRGYTWIFAFTGGGFALAALLTTGIWEPADPEVHTPHRSLLHHIRAAWQVWANDATFRRAATVGMLFIGAVLLFPHYQWLAVERLGTTSSDMVGWVIAQNIGVGCISPLAGVLADRSGNRIAMRFEIFVSAIVPLLALLLTSSLVSDGRRWYWMVFVLLGVAPVTLTTIFNYTLELAQEREHPRYLSTMRICFAVPFLFSPLAGLFLDLFPPESRFLGACLLFGTVSGLMILGGLLTFWMEEPRHRTVDTTELPAVRG